MPPSFPSHSAKSGENQTRLKIKREIPPVVTFEPPQEESSTDEEKKPIRYFVLVFPFLSFLIFFFFVFLFKYKRHRELPHVPRQRFRQSDYWDPGPGKPVATLYAEKEERKEDL